MLEGIVLSGKLYKFNGTNYTFVDTSAEMPMSSKGTSIAFFDSKFQRVLSTPDLLSKNIESLYSIDYLVCTEKIGDNVYGAYGSQRGVIDSFKKIGYHSIIPYHILLWKALCGDTQKNAAESKAIAVVDFIRLPDMIIVAMSIMIDREVAFQALNKVDNFAKIGNELMRAVRAARVNAFDIFCNDEEFRKFIKDPANSLNLDSQAMPDFVVSRGVSQGAPIFISPADIIKAKSQQQVRQKVFVSLFFLLFLTLGGAVFGYSFVDKAAYDSELSSLNAKFSQLQAQMSASPKLSDDFTPKGNNVEFLTHALATLDYLPDEINIKGGKYSSGQMQLTLQGNDKTILEDLIGFVDFYSANVQAKPEIMYNIEDKTELVIIWKK